MCANDSDGLISVYLKPEKGFIFRGEIHDDHPTGKGIFYSVKNGILNPINPLSQKQVLCKAKLLFEEAANLKRSIFLLSLELYETIDPTELI